MKAQKHACFHVNFPFIAPPLHHNGKGSIASPPVVLWYCVVIKSGSGGGGDGGAGSHGRHAGRVWVIGKYLRGEGRGGEEKGRGGEGEEYMLASVVSMVGEFN